MRFSCCHLDVCEYFDLTCGVQAKLFVDFRLESLPPIHWVYFRAMCRMSAEVSRPTRGVSSGGFMMAKIQVQYVNSKKLRSIKHLYFAVDFNDPSYEPVAELKAKVTAYQESRSRRFVSCIW